MHISKLDMPNLILTASKAHGRLVMHYHRRRFLNGYRPRVTRAPGAKLSVFSLTCERNFADSVISLLSFLKWVATPDRFVFVSDGSLLARSREYLCSIDPCVEIVDYDDFISKSLPAKVTRYAGISPMGKKLAVAMSVPVTQPTILMDSDILFFSGADRLRAMIDHQSPSPWKLVDVGPTFDYRLIENEREKELPANGGFVLLKQPLDFTFAMERFNKLEDPIHWTEQTVLHLTLLANNARALPADEFVLSLNDEYLYPDLFCRKPIVLRHYVSPVRHKMWLNMRQSI